MRTIIAGSRPSKENQQRLHNLLHETIVRSRFQISVVLSGLANGPDQWAVAWATAHRIPVERFPANWSKFGRRAGFLRNKEMADNADALICVWDGRSRGTKMMLDLALGKPIWVACSVLDDGFLRVEP